MIDGTTDLSTVSDEEIAVWLVQTCKWDTITVGGEQRLLDPVARVWRNVPDTATQVRARQARRRVLGTERDTAELNRYEKEYP